MPSNDDIRRYRENWQEEVDSAAQYRAMAEGERQEAVAQMFKELAATEEQHARFWAEKLAQAGQQVGPAMPSWRAKVLSGIARRLGSRLVLPTVASHEYAGRNAYARQEETERGTMAEQERTHARVLNSLLRRPSGAAGSTLARLEGRHRSVAGNALRAAVLGANDGLSSNLSLVMGMAGATVDTRVLMVTGLAGLLAGACSMALGEWVSMKSSRELAERELRIESDELNASPESERKELQLIYEAKGLEKGEAKKLSQELIRDPRTALDVLAREELGIDPEELGGSALVAAVTSFFLFATGAIIPVMPFFFLGGMPAIAVSAGASAVGLVALGTGISIFTGRPVWISAGRQLLLGLAAAAVTFGIGRAFRVSVAG